MAHLLRITDYNGTVSFNAGNNKLLDYVPRSPNLATVDFTPEALRDGGERLKTTRRNVTESALVILGGTSTDAMRSAVGSVESYLRQAEEYQERRSGSPVYMEFQPGGSGDVYRSEILGGKVELSDLTLSASQWNKNKARAVVAYTRRHYWEGAEGTIQLYNSGGTSPTGVTVYNCQNSAASQDIYVDIAGTSVVGNYPAPIRLEMQETTGGGTGAMNVYVGHDVGSNLSLTSLYEAEAATGAGTKFAVATCSNGSAFKSSWSTQQDASRYQWAVGAADMNNYAGRHFAVFARWATAPATDVKLRLKLGNTYGQTLYSGPQVYSSGNMLEKVGVIALPPGQFAGTSSYAGANLNLWGQGTAGGTMTLDYIMLMPLDSYVRYNTPDANSKLVTPHDYLVDDALTEALYLEDRSGEYIKVGGWYAEGRSPMLQPGKTQRLYFAWDNGGSLHAIEQTLTVTAYYRPRKLTF